jgi:hypothetical protein
LAFQVGAHEGQKITIDLADFGKGGPITGEITWDADMEPLPQTATDPQICQAFKECTKQVVDPKLVSNARQRWFGKDQKYKGDLSRRIDSCLSRYPIPQIPPR